MGVTHYLLPIAANCLSDRLQVAFPLIHFGGRLASNNAVVHLDIGSISNRENVTMHPEFHNGVAVALRLLPSDAETVRYVNVSGSLIVLSPLP